MLRHSTCPGVKMLLTSDRVHYLGLHKDNRLTWNPDTLLKRMEESKKDFASYPCFFVQHGKNTSDPPNNSVGIHQTLNKVTLFRYLNNLEQP